MSERNSACSSVTLSGIRTGPTSAMGTRGIRLGRLSSLPSIWLEAEQAGRRLSHGSLARHLSIGIGSVTARIESLLTEPTLTTASREWNNDPIADRKVVGTEFDHLAIFS